MEALLFLFAVGFAILSILSKSKKQARTKSAAPPVEPAKKPDEAPLPNTKEDWDAYLCAHGVAPKGEAPIPTPDPPAQSAIREEGEPEAEHAEHMRRILADEAVLRETRASEMESRQINRAHLRQAIVMREILDPPVSLRDE